MISGIVAVDDKRGMGKAGRIPWHIPEDIKWFRDKTRGHPCIMGRKTYEEIIKGLKKPLPGRTNIVITRDINFPFEIAPHAVVLTFDDAISAAKKSQGADEIFVIGGGQIFSSVLDKIQRLYVTKVKGVYGADVFFPDYSDFTKVLYEKICRDENHEYTFCIIERSD